MWQRVTKTFVENVCIAVCWAVLCCEFGLLALVDHQAATLNKTNNADGVVVARMAAHGLRKLAERLVALLATEALVVVCCHVFQATVCRHKHDRF